MLFVKKLPQYILQTDTIENLLNIESITVIGLLLAVCGLLIWDKVRNEKKYDNLLDKYELDQEKNKELLIELVKNGVLAAEQNTQAINTIREIYANDRK